MEGTNQNADESEKADESEEGTPRRSQEDLTLQRRLRRMVLNPLSDSDVLKEAMRLSGIQDAQFFADSIDRLVQRELMIRTDDGAAFTEAGVIWIRDTFYKNGDHFVGDYVHEETN